MLIILGKYGIVLPCILSTRKKKERKNDDNYNISNFYTYKQVFGAPLDWSQTISVGRANLRPLAQKLYNFLVFHFYDLLIQASMAVRTYKLFFF